MPFERLALRGGQPRAQPLFTVGAARLYTSCVSLLRSQTRVAALACGFSLLSGPAFSRACQEKPAEKPVGQQRDAAPAPELPFQLQLLETQVRFEVQGDSRKEVHTIVKIINILGAHQFARLAFDYNHAFQQVEIPEVHIRHAHGGTSDVLPSAVTDAIIPIYARHFSMEDVQSLIQFYESPLGQRVVKNLPIVAQESQEIGLDLDQKAAMNVLRGMSDDYPQLKQILPPENSKPEAAPAPKPAPTHSAAPTPSPAPNPPNPPHQ